MRFLPFLLRHLAHAWVRTASTVLAMALCVFLFCTLQSVLGQFDRIVDSRSPRKLVVRNGIGIVSSIPLHYGDRIRTLPGVTHVAATLMFGGVMPARREGRADTGAGTEWTSVFSNVAVDAVPYFAMSPELRVPPDEFQAFLSDLRGCVIGRSLADKFGWRIGDRVHLESFSSSLRKPSGPFEFVVRAVYDVAPDSGAEASVLFFHFRYLTEGLGWSAQGVPLRTHLFTVGVADPARAAETAAAIDEMFENSSDQTFTESEKAFTAGFISMVGDLGAVVNGVGLAVCFTILLVTANTMSMAVRERRTEIAVLKTLGFRSAQVMGLVVGEALLLGGLGGLVGVASARVALAVLTGTPDFTLAGLTRVDLRPPVALGGLGVALLLGLLAGLLPAWGAYRARVTDTLRDV